ELPVVEAVALVRDELALPYEEHLDLDRPALPVEAEDVLVGPPVLDHLLALLGGLDRLELIAQACRGLEALLTGRRLHAPAELARHLAVPPLEEQHRLTEVFLVDPAVDREHAGPEAALDVVFDAGAAAVAEHRVAAGAEREHLADRVERLPHGRRTGEGAEVAAPVLHDTTRDEHAWPRILHRDLDAHVALVVLQPDVVARPVLLDQVVLENERFLVVGGDQRLDVDQALDQEAYLAPLVTAAQVGADPRAQIGRFADVDDLGVLVLEEVDAGSRRNGREQLFRRPRSTANGHDRRQRRAVLLGAHVRITSRRSAPTAS